MAKIEAQGHLPSLNHRKSGTAAFLVRILKFFAMQSRT